MIASIPVGFDPFAPVFDSGNGYLYQANYNSDNVTVINGVTAIASVGVGFDPQVAAYDPANGYVYVPNTYSGNVSVINGTSVVATVPVSSYPISALYDPDTGYVYVVGSSGTVNVISSTTVLATVSVGPYPIFASVDSSNGYVYVANRGSNTVSILNGTTYVATVLVGSGPWFPLYDSGNGYVYVSDLYSDNVSVISGASVIATVSAGSYPSYEEYDNSDGCVYVENTYSSDVTVIRGTSAVATIGVGAYPGWGFYDPVSRDVFVPNGATDNVSVIGGTSVVATAGLGSDPYSGASSGRGLVYIANEGSNNVSVIRTAPTVPIQFTETGLPNGATWYVNVTGQAADRTWVGNGTGTQLSVFLPNGTFNYTVATDWKNWTTPATGAVTVSGRALNLSLTWTEVFFPVTFTEKGLTGQAWAVTFNGFTAGRTTGSIIALPSSNGTFPYNVSNVPGWRASAYRGTVAVAGRPASIVVIWEVATYAVSFREQGLNPGTAWSVTIGAVTNSTAAPGLNVIYEPNGSISFTIGSVPNFRPTPSSGSLVIAGAASPIESIDFSSSSRFAVTFAEAGLPNGTLWGVTFAGLTQRVGVGQLSFFEPNGTYGYALLNVPGYRPSIPYLGSTTVSGSPQDVSLVFGVSTFPVNFVETGLTLGTAWSVTVGSTTNTSIAPGVNQLQEANGTYAFVCSAIPGYSTVPSSGILVVNGATLTEDVSYLAPYTIAFLETGLGAGVRWTVTLNASTPTATSKATTGPSISFNVRNGTYAWNVTPIAGYSTPWRGVVTIRGNSSQLTVPFAPFLYRVTFQEGGIPIWSTWSVALNGNGSGPIAGSTTTTAFEVSNGTYDYQWGATPGFQVVVGSPAGRVTVSGSDAFPPSVTFAQVVYVLTFFESGVPTGSTWSVTLNGNSSGEIPGTITSTAFEIGNGTFGYSWGNTPGYRITTGSYTGSVTVSGTPPGPISAAFAPAVYAVTFRESGILSGGAWAVTLNGNSSGPIVGTVTSFTFRVGNGTFAYAWEQLPGYRMTAGSLTGTVAVSGRSPTAIGATFKQVVYSVTFTENGIPQGSDWSVALNGNSSGGIPGTLTSITFEIGNGTFGYVWGNTPGMRISTGAYKGELSVAGSNGTAVVVTFAPALYTVTFSETGLVGPPWAVTLNGNTSVRTTGDIIVFAVGNGTFNFNVSAVPGWEPDLNGGTVTVRGADVSVVVTFSASAFEVVFTETGLPAGTGWSVTLNGTPSQTSHSTTMVFSLNNATYTYAVAPVAGFTTKWSGTVTVDGTNASVTLAFALYTLAVTFAETGLPKGTNWEVTLGTMPAQTSKSAGIVFFVGNGTYNYTITPIAGFTVKWTGNVTVDGSARTVEVTFLPYTYAVTFTESGLPAGTNWSVSMNGATQSAVAGAVTFQEPNGSYSFAVNSPSGYTTNSSSGRLAVPGASVVVTISFTVGSPASPPPATILGLPPTTFAILVGGAGAVAVLAAALLVLRRRSGPQPAPPAAGPARGATAAGASAPFAGPRRARPEDDAEDAEIYGSGPRSPS